MDVGFQEVPSRHFFVPRAASVDPLRMAFWVATIVGFLAFQDVMELLNRR